MTQLKREVSMEILIYPGTVTGFRTVIISTTIILQPTTSSTC